MEMKPYNNNNILVLYIYIYSMKVDIWDIVYAAVYGVLEHMFKLHGKLIFRSTGSQYSPPETKGGVDKPVPSCPICIYIHMFLV